ncbi:protein phosphatase [Lithospermum erythrorhizon]|uniref:Protein phosphatase n=1 Tax=Lithospermum erythrorhizon TaxID=34254 RepID=A0AAV3PTH6_LITER
METGSLPVREGEPDCSYYIRTGLCRFGASCRFNHPPNRKLAIASARMKGEYPERMGQPDCQYYLRTGTCKFGVTCKFHHPRDAGTDGRVLLNVLGYPLRPQEAECSYYLRTGQCKFGGTCKFHHPQPSNMMISLSSPLYTSVQTPTAPGQPSYGASFVSSSGYAPLMLPQRVVSIPGWNTYSGQVGSVTSSESNRQPPGSSQIHGTSRLNDTPNMGSQGQYSSYQHASLPEGYYAMQGGSVFPERPGQPECQFYMKTGDCKFGGVCKFHHPRERLIPAPNCLLSPRGLPLRPGEPLCMFYSRYGICKFGPSCKFDHPMEVFSNIPGSPSDDPVGRRILSSAPGTVALSSSAEVVDESSSTNPRRLSLSEARSMSSGDNKIEPEE